MKLTPSIVHQPREHAVPCGLCGIRAGRPKTMTWASNGLCPSHQPQMLPVAS